MDIENYRRLGLHSPFIDQAGVMDSEVNGHKMGEVSNHLNVTEDQQYNPYLIKSTPRKEIKVFLQSGAKNLNSIVGNWPLANKLMAEAFSFSGYQSKFAFGEGGHSLRHGGAIFADSLR